MYFKKELIIFLITAFLSSCSIQMKFDTPNNSEKRESMLEFIVQNTKLKTYQGWWVYGEGQHIFKDEKTLDEYNLEFPKENMEELKDLYLAMCEMEYFPMECNITGHLQKHILENKLVLIVSDFEILYIQGCE